MKKTKILSIAIALICAISFSGCGTQTTESKTTSDSDALVLNKDKKEIIMKAEVNGKYFTEPTRHGVVFKDGSNGEKSVLRALSSEIEFHDALVSIGATPGNNVTMEDMKADKTNGVSVQGSKLDVFVKWEGSDKEIPFTDIIKATEERPMDIRFGGNLENAKEYKTGCVLCLDSCAVGITSNAAYPTGSTQNKLVSFTGDQSVLPEDGTKVSVIFRLAE